MFGTTWDKDKNEDNVRQGETKMIFSCLTKIGGTIRDTDEKEIKI